MLCPKCGAENTDQAELCVNCGEMLLTEEQSNSQEISDTDTSHSSVAENADEKQVASAANDQSGRAERKRTNKPKRQQRITDIDLKPDVSDKPVVSSGFNIAIIIATLILPIIGVIVGFTYLRKEDPEAQKAGKTWLILGGIMIVVNILLITGM